VSHDIRQRKQDHVELVASRDVTFRNRTNGFENVELVYNALPEIDMADVSTSTTLFGRSLHLPLYASGMTGGYADAERINAMLAEVCATTGIGMGLGSMRAAVDDPSLAATFRSVMRQRPPLLLGNVGAVQVARWHNQNTLADNLARLLDIMELDVLAIHLNPLQELLQPEGEPEFAGVAAAIAAAVERCPLPIVVKEVGAGVSANVAKRLIACGVNGIDVAGAGGTSWAGVEILRHARPESVEHLWDVGLPTARCLRECQEHCLGAGIPMLASGGIVSGTHVAKAIAMGASACGVARPLLQAVMAGGVEAGVAMIGEWELHIRQWMFLTGSPSVSALQSAPVTFTGTL
jgi:isopentenyl-diphosphate delta-isomerase